MDLKNVFLELGYKDIEYEKIRKDYSLERLNDETLSENIKRNYKYLIEYGFKKEEILKITKKYPNIYCFSLDKIIDKIKFLENNSFKKEEIIKMIKNFPSLFGLSIENIKQKIDNMISLGYEKDDIKKMFKSTSVLFGYTSENIQSKIKDLINLGYKKEEALYITKIMPSIFSLSTKTIQDKINAISNLGYKLEEVLNMTINFPSIFCLSIDSLREKIKFYDSIDMHKLCLNDPKRLMQGISLTYARYCHLTDLGENININNYTNLFIADIRYSKKYNIKREDLIEKYNYEKYIRRNINGRII